MICTIELSKEELVNIYKSRLSKTIDLRCDNPYATYYDWNGSLKWNEEHFKTLSEKELLEKILKL